MKANQSTVTKERSTFYALNTNTHKAELLNGFAVWEQVQGAFRYGIVLSDGTSANGIGRCFTKAEFIRKASLNGFAVLDK